MESSKEKLDKLLGIEDGQSIDDFLDNLSVEADQVENTLASVDTAIKDSVKNVDTAIEKVKSGQINSDEIALANIESSLAEIKELINVSKKVVMHVYESIITTDLVDSELIGSMAKLIEATHINIADYIGLYKQRVMHYDKMKLMNLQQQQRLELLKLKHEYDMQKVASKDNTVTAEGMVSYTQEDMIKFLQSQGSAIDNAENIEI